MTAPRARLLETARLAAVAAGEAIMKVYASDFEIYQKTDKTPVTEADLAAERIIVEVLADAFPDIPIVSEELADRGDLPAAAERFWAVDPLDGTREFIAKNGEFAVLIGLIEHGRPVLGVVHGPAVGLTYAACGPGTATRQVNGAAPEPINARRPGDDGLVIIHSRSHENSRRLAEYLQRHRVRERVKCGSALKFGLIAAGEGDLYPRFGTTMEWDTAAGQAVLEAAGGRVETVDGALLTYGKPGFKNDGFLAWGRRYTAFLVNRNGDRDAWLAGRQGRDPRGIGGILLLPGWRPVRRHGRAVRGGWDLGHGVRQGDRADGDRPTGARHPHPHRRGAASRRSPGHQCRRCARRRARARPLQLDGHAKQ